MYRVCLKKSDGKLIQAQSGGRVERLPREAFKTDSDYAAYAKDCDALEAARLETLKQNAIKAGYGEADIDVKWIAAGEWEAILAAGKPTLSPEQLKEAAIQAEMRKIAEASLIAKGELTAVK